MAKVSFISDYSNTSCINTFWTFPFQGPEFGLIFIPGAQLLGETYAPLCTRIQELFPGKLWVGLTEEWTTDYPNPLEINEAVHQCLDDAE